MKTLSLFVFLAVLLVLPCAAQTNLVVNGSFEESTVKPGEPDGWAGAGNAAVHQKLTLDIGRAGGRSAKLECTEFNGDGPDFHAMLCQVGKIAVRRGQWYRLSLWAKAERLKAGSVEVALTNTRPWENAGLSDAFTPSSEWQPFEFIFLAKDDLPAASSRLQIWFKTTGTLWIDDVSLTAHSGGQEWLPQLSTKGVTNFIPNSSFECGPANWGSFTYGLSGWAGGLYRLEGGVDDSVSQHGAHSLKLALSPERLPVYYFDYYEPVRQPVKRVFAANHGWLRVTPGEKLTLSAWLRADRANVVAQLLANEAPSRLQRKEVRVGETWQRYEFTFTPNEGYLFIAAGLDLEASRMDAATLWLDAMQLERGGRATPYRPRAPVESFIETAKNGNIFTDAPAGLEFAVRAFNDTDSETTFSGTLRVTDFFDRVAFEQKRQFRVPAHRNAVQAISGLCKGREGFFRATWKALGTEQSLRSAQINPVFTWDSPFGFNHAYPWDFLVQLAREAGVNWWRDWSAKWQTVEPAKGQFDFSVADQQIERVAALGGRVEVLLPFPSASWSTTAKPAEVEKAAGKDSYLRGRLPVAYAPTDLKDFGNYAAETARHYSRLDTQPVTYFQVLNEPVYTSYALPRQFGYSLQDYLRLLQVASGALHTAVPNCRVVGGISAGLDSGYTRDFIKEGGLKFVDVFDLHMYDAARPAEGFEDSFQSLEELIRAHGGPKPVWITEWGCYADDDPASVPQSVGDETMNRCRWPSERAATEHIVKFATVAFAHGVEKIFFHAGTCGPINGSDAGGVLFEYGGAPRKMYAGVAAFTRVLGARKGCVCEENEGGLHAYVFKTGTGYAAVAWADAERMMRPVEHVRVYDIMGNEQHVPTLKLGSSPVYLSGSSPSDLLASPEGQVDLKGHGR